MDATESGGLDVLKDDDLEDLGVWNHPDFLDGESDNQPVDLKSLHLLVVEAPVF